VVSYFISGARRIEWGGTKSDRDGLLRAPVPDAEREVYRVMLVRPVGAAGEADGGEVL